MTAYTYILHSGKLDKYYVGSTTDMLRRLEDHNPGKRKIKEQLWTYLRLFYKFMKLFYASDSIKKLFRLQSMELD